MAALDGNGIRILSRVFGIAENPWTLSGVTYFEKQAAAILPKNQAALFNQALMDFGSKFVCRKIHIVKTVHLVLLAKLIERIE